MLKLEVEKRTKWECPEDGGVALLTMPNLPKPMHTVAPRNIIGPTAWDKMRRLCYYKAGYKSEISGEDGSTPGSLHGHEGYTIDYANGTSTFVRAFAITPLEHVYFIHSGRMLTLFKRGNPLYSKAKVLEGVEHGFRLIHDWNVAHPDKPKLKVYATFLDYLKEPELENEMEELIQKYKIEFWAEDKKRLAPWGDWRMIFNGKEYPTPYKDQHEWEKAMEFASQTDGDRQAKNPFVGGAFDEINKILKEEND